MKYIPGSNTHWDVEKIKDKISQFNTKPNLGIHIIEDNRGNFIGEASIFTYMGYPNTYEIGFILDNQYWRKGLGTKVCQYLIDHCKKNLHATAVYARMYEVNIASTKACLKCGMEIIAKDVLFDGQARLTMVTQFAD
jgi:ribosomal-protein-alanine N-acetyltransferase